MFVLKMKKKKKKNQFLYTLKKTQWEHFYHCHITTQTFHHNRACNLQPKRFPVVLLITVLHIYYEINN